MCVISMIGDHYNDKWDPFKKINPYTIPTSDLERFLAPNRQEFEALKKEVEEMKKLLERALKYDIENNQPECEIEDKVALLKKVAELVGVSLEDVFPQNKK